MEKQVLYYMIKSGHGKVQRLGKDLESLLHTLMQNPQLYADAALKAAIDSEHLTRHLRRLIYSASASSRQEYLLRAACSLDISATIDRDGSVTITLPLLLPRRKTVGAKFIADTLSTALNIFVKEHPQVLRFGECTICVTHIYDKALGTKGRIRDYDNLEQKEIFDVINLYLLEDDSGELCNHYYTTKLGDEDATIISIMENRLFKERFL